MSTGNDERMSLCSLTIGAAGQRVIVPDYTPSREKNMSESDAVEWTEDQYRYAAIMNELKLLNYRISLLENPHARPAEG
jgi:hypothetical protein